MGKVVSGCGPIEMRMRERLCSSERVSKPGVVPMGCADDFTLASQAMRNVASNNPNKLIDFLEIVIAEAEARLKLTRGLSNG